MFVRTGRTASSGEPGLRSIVCGSQILWGEKLPGLFEEVRELFSIEVGNEDTDPRDWFAIRDEAHRVWVRAGQLARLELRQPQRGAVLGLRECGEDLLLHPKVRVPMVSALLRPRQPRNKLAHIARVHDSTGYRGHAAAEDGSFGFA